MSRTFLARIRFFGPERGGPSRPPLPGVRPLLQVGPVFTSAIIRPQTEVAAFELDRDYEVLIEVVFWEEYRHLFEDPMRVRLFDGSRQIAEGEFLERIRS